MKPPFSYGFPMVFRFSPQQSHSNPAAERVSLAASDPCGAPGPGPTHGPTGQSDHDVQSGGEKRGMS